MESGPYCCELPPNTAAFDKSVQWFEAVLNAMLLPVLLCSMVIPLAFLSRTFERWMKFDPSAAQPTKSTESRKAIRFIHCPKKY